MLKPTTKTVVLFDTNAYRQLSGKADPEAARSRVGKLLEAEHDHGIQALASTIVQMELLARLAEPAREDYQNVRSAVVALFQHCSQRLGEDRVLAISVTSELQLCKSLYDCEPLDVFQGHDLVRAIVKRAAEDPSEDNLTRMRQDFRRVADRVAEAEQNFINDMRQHVVLGFDPTATDWDPFKTQPIMRKAGTAYCRSEKAREAVAMMWVLKASALADVRESEEQLREKAQWVADKYRVPIVLYLHVVEKIFQSGYDLSKKNRGNTIWDIDLAHWIGGEHTVEGAQVRFVTGDQELVRAAETAGGGRLIYGYAEYRAALTDGTFH